VTYCRTPLHAEGRSRYLLFSSGDILFLPYSVNRSAIQLLVADEISTHRSQTQRKGKGKKSIRRVKKRSLCALVSATWIAAFTSASVIIFTYSELVHWIPPPSILQTNLIERLERLLLGHGISSSFITIIMAFHHDSPLLCFQTTIQSKNTLCNPAGLITLAHHPFSQPSFDP